MPRLSYVQSTWRLDIKIKWDEFLRGNVHADGAEKNEQMDVCKSFEI